VSSHLLSKKLQTEIYKTVILPLSCIGVKVCLTLNKEHRLRAFEIRVLRRIFGPKREKVAEGWRKIRIEELHNS
jgi:hypothetical protein